MELLSRNAVCTILLCLALIAIVTVFVAAWCCNLETHDTQQKTDNQIPQPVAEIDYRFAVHTFVESLSYDAKSYMIKTGIRFKLNADNLAQLEAGMKTLNHK